MKNLIKIFIFFAFYNLNAQVIIPFENMVNYKSVEEKNGLYFKDINGNLDKFVGEWKYENTFEKVELKIFKNERIDSGLNYYHDGITIQFRYTQNGIIIFDTINSNHDYLISMGRFRFPSNTNLYHILYTEPDQNTFGIQQWVDLEFLNGNISSLPQIIWQTHYEVTDTYTATAPKMPIQMTLIKQ